MHDVPIRPRSIERLAAYIGPERGARLLDEVAAPARAALEGRVLFNVNSTAQGGGVAEMLHTMLGYVRAGGVDARWLVIDGDADFFTVTKRIHNHLYGQRGDGGPLGPAEAAIYERVLHGNADELATQLRPGDIVLLHDPQTAGLAARVAQAGAKVIWRCHVGIDEQNANSDQAWEFLRPHLLPYVDRFVFTRRQFAPAWVPADRLEIVRPSIDPFSPKNQQLTPETVSAILNHVGILGGGDPAVSPMFVRSDGTPGRVERFCDAIRTGPPPGPDVPLVVQVSRWDPLKDMVGVMEGFARHVAGACDAHLVLAGPTVTAVADDPEGGGVLRDCWAAWRALPHALRRRVALVCLPMADLDENGVIVNALQRHATVVVQKSLAEGFGLTVVEAMLKGRPVVASAVGGILDQVTDGETGLLLPDPTDLATFGRKVSLLLDDPAQRERIGAAACDAAVRFHLGDQHLSRWLEVIGGLLAER